MLKLAFRNLLRHKGRTALTLGAILLGVVGLILSGGFVQDIYVQLREWTIHSRLGHLQVYAEGHFHYGRRQPYQYMVAEPDRVAEGIAGVPHVVDVLRRVNFDALVNNGRGDLPVMGEGVEPDKEARLGSALRIVSGRQLAASDRLGVLVGQGVASSLQLQPGDYVTLVATTAAGSMNSLELEVVGSFASVSKDYDARAVRIPLDAARELLDTDAVHALVVSLDDTLATEAVRLALSAVLPAGTYEVKSWEELDDFYRKTVALYRRQFGFFQVVILLMVLLSVANSVNMSAYERTGEFGTLRAFGERSSGVVRLIVTENVMLGLAGALLGAALGLLLAWAISLVGIPMPPPPNSDLGYTALIRIEPQSVLLALAIGFGATVLSALLAAFRAARVPVVDGLRWNV